MQTIYKPRRFGKTTDLIKICAKSGGRIVCHNKQECHRIEVIARTLYLKAEIDHIIDFSITYDEFLNKFYRGLKIKSFHIDNADMFLQYLSEIPILTITITNDL